MLQRRALLLCLASLVGWLAWSQARTPAHPWADLTHGHHADHFSHLNAARALPRVGLDLWRRGAAQLFPAATPTQLAAMPADVRAGGSWTGGIYVVPGWPLDKPWTTSWSSKARPYPPGDLVVVAPVALLYHFTDLSLANANRLLIALFLILAHVALYFALGHALRDGNLTTPLVTISALLFYSEAIHWSLKGFYDTAAIIPLLLCAGFLHQRRGLAAAVAYSAAAAIHFRVYFLAPWALYAAWLFLRDQQWRGFRPRDYGAALAGLACAAASLTAFALVTPTIAGQDVTNPVNLAGSALNWNAAVPLWMVVTLGGAALVVARAWLDLAMLSWMALMIFYLREAYPWHILVLMTWLPAPVSVARPGAAELVRAVRLGVIAVIAMLVLGNALWPQWVLDVFR